MVKKDLSIAIENTYSNKLKSPTVFEVAREVKKALAAGERVIEVEGKKINEPNYKRITLREEIGHHLPYVPFQPDVTVQSYLERDSSGKLNDFAVRLSIDNEDIPIDVILESATAPLRDKRFPREMSEVDKSSAAFALFLKNINSLK